MPSAPPARRPTSRRAQHPDVDDDRSHPDRVSQPARRTVELDRGPAGHYLLTSEPIAFPDRGSWRVGASRSLSSGNAAIAVVAASVPASLDFVSHLTKTVPGPLPLPFVAHIGCDRARKGHQ